jgi:hypothetical protein
VKILAVLFTLIIVFDCRAEFLAGFAKSDITPTQSQISRGEIHLGGFGLGQKAESVEDPIFARALTIAQSDGENALAIVILDVPGISNRVVDRIAGDVSFLLGISRDHVYVGATHTHYGPDLQGLWGGVSEDYLDQLILNSVSAVIKAFQYRVRVNILASKTTAENHNRRGWDYTDPEMTVLDFVATRSGQRIGTLINFAAHPVLGTERSKISPDFCASLTNKVEATLGGVAVFANGIVGDVSPIRMPGPSARIAYGEYLADRTISSLVEQTSIDSSEIYFDEKTWKNRVSNVLFLLADFLGLLKYDMIHKFFRTYIRVNVGYFRLGKTVQSVVFPGESLTRNGLAVKNQMKSPFKLWLGLTGNTLGYFVPSDEWKVGRHKNYEESISLDKHVGDRARDALLEIISRDNFIQ